MRQGESARIPCHAAPSDRLLHSMGALSRTRAATTLLTITLSSGCIQPAALPPLPPDPGDVRTSIVHVRSTTAPVDVRIESDDESRPILGCRTPCRATL